MLAPSHALKVTAIVVCILVVAGGLVWRFIDDLCNWFGNL